MRSDTRERLYAMCVKCGCTTVTVNFDCVPSARVGLWGRCVDSKDYTHHSFATLSAPEYQRLREMSAEARLNWWRYGRGTG